MDKSQKTLLNRMACMPACPLLAQAQLPRAATLLLQHVTEKATAGLLIGSGLHMFVPNLIALLSHY